MGELGLNAQPPGGYGLDLGWATGGTRVEFVRTASSFVYIIGFSVVI